MSDLFDGVLPFVRTAQARSFRVAAEELGVTPAAVSKAVKRLEAELGVQLLHRTTRRVDVSAEGAAFLTRCEDAIALVKAGREGAAASARAPRGTLTVSASYVLGSFLVARLPRFAARYPALRLDLRLTDRRSRLVDEGVDVALRVGPLPDSSLVARRVLRTRWVTVASPAYLARHAAPEAPEDLAAHACIRFRSPRGKAVPWTFLDATEGEARTVEVPGHVDLDQGEVIVAAAIAGLGVAQVFDFMVGDPLADGRLIQLLPSLAAQGPDVHALVLPGPRVAAKVRAFLDFVAEDLGR
jgi:DNA-binding transcriptional LysR family regulator